MQVRIWAWEEIDEGDMLLEGSKRGMCFNEVTREET